MDTAFVVSDDPTLTAQLKKVLKELGYPISESLSSEWDNKLREIFDVAYEEIKVIYNQILRKKGIGRLDIFDKLGFIKEAIRELKNSDSDKLRSEDYEDAAGRAVKTMFATLSGKFQGFGPKSILMEWKKKLDKDNTFFQKIRGILPNERWRIKPEYSSPDDDAGINPERKAELEKEREDIQNQPFYSPDDMRRLIDIDKELSGGITVVSVSKTKNPKRVTNFTRRRE